MNYLIIWASFTSNLIKFSETNAEICSYKPWRPKWKIFSRLKLCLATAIHNFKWLKICVICEIYIPTYECFKIESIFYFENTESLL